MKRMHLLQNLNWCDCEYYFRMTPLTDIFIYPNTVSLLYKLCLSIIYGLIYLIIFFDILYYYLIQSTQIKDSLEPE